MIQNGNADSRKQNGKAAVIFCRLAFLFSVKAGQFKNQNILPRFLLTRENACVAKNV